MVVVYRVGRAPITYSANIFSWATAITFCLYIAAIVFPYLICGWTLNFFPLYEVRAERPKVYLKPDIQYNITGAGGTNIYFKVSKDNSGLSGCRIPVINIPQKHDDRLLTFSAYFPVTSEDTIDKLRLSFTFDTYFQDIDKTFESYVDIDKFTLIRPCSVNIIGSLSFTQEIELDSSRSTEVQLSKEYVQFTRTRAVPVNYSNPLIGGVPTFIERNSVWTYGEECDLLEIHFSMRIPLIQTYVKRNGWYSFLDGWTSYVSFFIPLILIIRRTLEAFFRSGIIPVQKVVECELNKEAIPKFNR